MVKRTAFQVLGMPVEAYYRDPLTMRVSFNAGGLSLLNR